MELKVVSKCCIGPSSPTPDHPKTHNLSLLDQFVPPMHIPVVLFYPYKNQTHTDKSTSQRSSSHLKHSLSETLTRFYPLAGKINDNLSIDCNDEGAYYVEAKANCSLQEYLKDQAADFSLMHKFLYNEFDYFHAIPGSYVTMVQETTFNCGGIVICVIFSHMVVDGTSLSFFLKAWSTATRACNSMNEVETESICPNFDAPFVFLQSEAYPKEATMMSFFYPLIRTSRSSTRRFVFDASAVASLKARARSSSKVENPTRVEAVSAFLCKCIMGISKSKSRSKSTLVTQAMNLRPRAVPPFPGCCMGNFVWASFAFCQELDLASLVWQLRESFQRVGPELVEKLQGDGGMVNLCEALKEMGGLIFGPNFSRLGHIGFTSWCNFGIYDIDFGWGKPAWVTPVTSTKPLSPFITTIYLMDTREENGLEAIAILDEDEMVVLEHDKELLAYASVVPDPLSLCN